jgi:ABC-type antimicrobial peptide transport system permease subunit
MSIALVFGMLAILLSAIGIYGVLSYLVAQRRREIGIRIAVGSTRERVVRLILKETLVLVVLGLFLGFCAAVALRHALVDQIYGIGVLNPELILSVMALLGVVAFAASSIPVCRAMRIDPIIVLNDQ